MSKPVVLHLGRDGEVPGGMTQVINGLLKWDFSRCQVALVRTRGATSRTRELGMWLRALATISRCRPSRHVVVGHLSQGGSFVREGSLLLLARLKGIRAVAQLHGSGFAAFTRRRPGLVRFVLRNVHCIIVLSQESADIATSIAPRTPVRRVPNTTSRDSCPSEKDNFVIFAGKISDRKGADVLLEAWRTIAPDDWQLVLAGPVAPDFHPGPLVASVKFVGNLPNSEVLEMVKAARIAVLPSRAEAMPVFILEAMAREAAVVASRVGGIPELLGESGGWLVEPGSVDDLARALKTLMFQPRAAEAWAEAAKRRFDLCYAPEIVYEKMELHWLGLLE